MRKFIVTDYGVKPDSSELQTKALQKVLDLCKDEGGCVVIPRGKYRTASLRIWSDTVLHLASEAQIIASDEVNDYEVFALPQGLVTKTDRDLFPDYALNKQSPELYRRAVFSAYGEKNISIIGEVNSCIDGSDCYDAEGEEGFRGPHGFFFTNCENLTFRGYTIKNTGNFMHQLDCCKNITFENISFIAGHDGTHMHFCENILIDNCKFITGDDCIAGANMRNLTVRNCELNTSCQVFRVSGKNIKIEDCYMYGPGYYPHRMTIVKGKGNYLPREEGRHNAFYAFIYFASPLFPDSEPHDISFKNCIIKDIDAFMFYDYGNTDMLQGKSQLERINMENVKISGVSKNSVCNVKKEYPLEINLKNVKSDFRENNKKKDIFGTDKVNVKIHIKI